MPDPNHQGPARDALLAAALDTAVDGVIVLTAVRDTAGRVTDFDITAVNRAAERLAPCRDTGLVGRRVLEVFPSVEPGGLFETCVRVTQTGRPGWIERHDGPGRGSRISAARCGDGVAVTFAETQRRSDTGQAQRAHAAQAAFLANMSHEIRTPMAAILGYADLLLDAGQTEADKRNHAHAIARNGRHLMSILSDVLDLSKIEAGQMSVEHIPCQPQQVFADVISMLMPKAMEKGIGLNLDDAGALPQRVLTDPARLRQVLFNLVGNAIKFTNAGRVHIRVHAEPIDPQTLGLRIDITDTGIGISADQFAGLFKPFSQADNSTTRPHGGTGLGLAISRHLCRLLGGDLTCTSSPGVGSTFTATLRVGVVHEQSSATRTTDGPATLHLDCRLDGVRVLLIEDGVDNQRLINHYLTKAGAGVTIAENGRVGLDAAIAAEQSGEPFGLVVMDMRMPVLDGYDATRQLRAVGYTRPIIALTAHASEDDRRKCLAAGCSDYLTKPVDRHKLVRTAASHVAAMVRAGSGI